MQKVVKFLQISLLKLFSFMENKNTFFINWLIVWGQFIINKFSEVTKSRKGSNTFSKTFFVPAPLMPLKILSLFLVSPWSLFCLVMFFCKELVSYFWSCLSREALVWRQKIPMVLLTKQWGSILGLNMELNLYFREISLLAGFLPGKNCPSLLWNWCR